ncbi:dynein axonemal intermediate chain 7 isoform X1 [Saccopteryx bilineata]|uniref:dynein axonemal intermediate chain 7 isoform X1 n=2 Tax=Saccopteryx bilineata TaxID=59482 RepID=UPI00338E13EB
MGPKKNKSGKKKSKISKAKRLKWLQEEEEKRQREEEEARVKAEKEEMERLAIEQIEKEKWQQLEAKALERKNEELEELYLLERCFSEAEKLKQDNGLLSQWKHYIRCDGTPDPTVAPEINTFISLWKEETDETFEEVITKSKLVLHLIDELKLILLDAPPYDLQDTNTVQYRETLLELQELLQLKFDRATEMLLRQASSLADLDTGNMEKVIRDENVTLYVWANLRKNPRYSSVRCSEIKIGFEIPTILATSDIALRLLHTRYDHVTPLSPVPRLSQVPASTSSHFVKDKDGQAAVIEEFQEEYKQPEIESNSVQQEEIKVEEQGDIETQMCSVQKESVDTLKMKLLSETILAAQLLLLENVTEKPYYFEDKEVDMCGFTTLGGVYHLDILELPPQPKQGKSWMIVEIHKGGLQKYVYPPATTEDSETENTFPPIEVKLEVHENVIFFEDPMVARWDAKGKLWKTDGIRNVTYKSGERLLTFSLETFGPVTLIQDTHINMPYQSWELRPLDVNQVLLIVATLFIEIQIQIKEDLCMLSSLKLNKKKHSSILEGKWMTPISFIIALKEAGLNIFPTGHSHFYVVINHKVPLVEMKAYRQMALLSSAFMFGWSRWNMHCDSKNVVFKVREHLTKEEPDVQNFNWTLLMFGGDRALRLKINEYSEAYSEDLEEETEFHSTLYHMVEDFASKGAMEKIRNSNCQFIDSVCHMLLSIRLLSFS